MWKIRHCHRVLRCFCAFIYEFFNKELLQMYVIILNYEKIMPKKFKLTTYNPFPEYEYGAESELIPRCLLGCPPISNRIEPPFFNSSITK